MDSIVNWKARVKGSSLVEVIISLIIISMIFGFASQIYLQVQRSVLNWQKLSASVCLDNAYAGILAESNVKPGQVLTELRDFVVKKEIYPSALAENLWVVKLEALNKEGLSLVERKYLLVKDKKIE
jgi:hypothetical protein